MPINNCLNNIRQFLRSAKKADAVGMFRVTVVAFEEHSNINCGRSLAELLKQNNLLEINFFSEPFSKNFLNLQSRNFFDFIDRGTQILQKTHSDMVIWGYEENGKIRLNFQVADQYLIPNDLYFSLLDSLFVPLSFFANVQNFSESVLLLIYGMIIAAIKPITAEQKRQKPKLLRNVIALLSADTSPKDLSREFMPYIMNILGKIYLSSAKDNITENDADIIQKLFTSALENRHLMRLPIYYGCIYNNLGQFYEILYKAEQYEVQAHLREAISAYQNAQKYLNRNYPYDYGMIAYHLALLYYEFWKQTSDLQALRDAVSQLREAEKVYSLAQFPQSWCHVEGLLGYYLTSLGMSTISNDIMQLAINCYKNQQEIITQYTYPEQWAKIQENIGNIYYLLGKQDDDDNFMYEARNYFNSALEVYNAMKLKDSAMEAKNRLAKVHNYVN